MPRSRVSVVPYLLTLVSFAGGASAQDYVLEPLRSPDGVSTAASSSSDIDDFDNVIGWAVSSGQTRSVVWSVSGVATANPGLAGSTYNQGESIEGSGLFYGTSYDATNGNRAWRNSAGVLSELTGLGGAGQTRVYHNTASGFAAGQSALSNGEIRAVSWQGTTATNLGTLPGGNFSSAGKCFQDLFGIQFVTGQSNRVVNGVSSSVGFVHQNGQMTALEPLPGGSDSVAFGIAQENRVVGWAYGSGGVWQPTMWSGPTWIPSPLGILSGYQFGVAGDINGTGAIVGYAQSPVQAGQPSNRAFLQQPGAQAVALDALVPPGTGTQLKLSWGINERGVIVADGSLPNGTSSAFRLRQIVHSKAVWSSGNYFQGGSLYYLNNNFSRRGDPLVGAIAAASGWNGGPLEYNYAGGAVQNSFLQVTDGAKSVAEIGSYVFYTGDDGQGLRRLNSNWTNQVPASGYEILSASYKIESIATDGTALFGNSDLNRGRVYGWNVTNTSSSFSLSEKWTSSDLGGRVRGLTVFRFPGQAAPSIYVSNGGDANGPRGVWAINSAAGTAAPVLTASGAALAVPGGEAVYQVCPLINGGERLLFISTSSKLYVWSMQAFDRVASATPLAVYSTGTPAAGEIALLAPDGSPMPAGIYGVGMDANRLFLIGGSQLYRFDLNSLLEEKYDYGMNRWTATRGAKGVNFQLVTLNGSQAVKTIQSSAAGHPTIRLVTGHPAWKDYVVEADVTLTRMENDTGIGDPGASLLLRYQGVDNWYSFSISNGSNSPRWKIARRVGSSVGTIAQGSVVTLPLNQKIRLRAVASGSKLELWTDAGSGFVKQCEVTDAQYPTGRVGIHSSLADAVFDNVVVQGDF